VTGVKVGNGLERERFEGRKEDVLWNPEIPGMATCPQT
jgi:hypothetical protein